MILHIRIRRMSMSECFPLKPTRYSGRLVSSVRLFKESSKAYIPSPPAPQSS